MFKTRVHIKDSSLFRKIKIINFLKKKAKFTKLQAGAYFMGVGAKVKRFRNILKKKKTKILIVTQCYYMLKRDGSCVKSKILRGTVIQKNIKRRYEKLGYIFNSYTNRRLYKSYKKTI